MRLRPFRAEDLPTLYAIDQACFAPGISYSRAELTGFVAHRNSRTWVAEEAGEIAGFLIAQREPRQLVHIITIDVLKPWRRRGVGSLLMDAAERWAHAQGVGMIGLETAQDNVAAQSFYRHRGYRKIGEIAQYYADGTAAWVMLKDAL